MNYIFAAINIEQESFPEDEKKASQPNKSVIYSYVVFKTTCNGKIECDLRFGRICYGL